MGVGGGGTNAVSRMVDAGLHGVEFIAANTDAQALAMCDADIKLNIGHESTKGLGAGANPEVGFGAASESRDDIKEALKGADMVFVTAGEGGGTGTGAAPVIAEIAKNEIGALTVGVVTRPFDFEGTQRSPSGQRGHRAPARGRRHADRDPQREAAGRGRAAHTMLDAFREADNVLRQGVQGITDLITIPGLINLDFADVRTIMHDAGSALMGIGTAGRREPRGGGRQGRDLLAAAGGVRGRRDRHPAEHHRRAELGLFEVNEAAEIIQNAADPNANIIFGAVIDEGMGDEVRVTVIGTGFDHRPGRAGARERAAAPPDRGSAHRRPRALVVGDPRRRHRRAAVPALTPPGVGWFYLGTRRQTPGPRGRFSEGACPSRPDGVFDSLACASTPATSALSHPPLRVPSGGGRQARALRRVGDAGPVPHGVRAEHMAVREGLRGLRRLPHGEIETSGPQALELLQRLLSNDVAAIPVERGAVQPALPRGRGGPRRSVHLSARR